MRIALSAPLAVISATVGVLFLPAGPAAAADSAISTIGLLEAQGFDVRVDRVGSAPLSDCVVTNVRNPQERKELVRVNGRGGRDRLVSVVVGRSVTVSLDCSAR